MSPAEAGTVHFVPASDQSLLVSFGESISAAAGERVEKLLRLLQSRPLHSIRNLHPGYSSLLIRFDALRTTHSELEAELRGYAEQLDAVQIPERRLVDIPVCYGGKFGPDLDDVAAFHHLSSEEVVHDHASATYKVCFLGFVPGFPYLSGLSPALATPRLATPRRQIPAGSVGIAGNQTGVYPFGTPAGWRLIGRTPLTLFDPDRAEMSLLTIGDRVRFSAISRHRFEQLIEGRSSPQGDT
jgi:inhibitor of KinA